MSWQDDRADAYWYADSLEIPRSMLDDTHREGWTWQEIHEQILQTWEAHEYWQILGPSSTYMESMYPVNNHDELPEWANWYHG